LINQNITAFRINRKASGVLQLDGEGKPIVSDAGIRVIDNIFEVQRGNIVGQRAIGIQGVAVAMTTAFRTVWDDESLVDIGLLNTPALVEVASTDANDTSAGSGARTLLLSGLNSLNEEITETIILNGQTEVSSVNQYRAINDMRVLTVGATRGNEGKIYCGTGVFTAGVPATKYAVMSIADTIAKIGHFTVPLEKSFFLTQIILMVGDTSRAVNFRLREDDGIIDRITAPFELGQGNFIAEQRAAEPVRTGNMIKIEGKLSSQTANVAILMSGILVDD